MDALLSTLQRYRTLQPILHTLIAALSTNALTFVSVAIGRLREYEPKVEKAGKISGEARRQLYMTRSTQGGAAGAIILSLTSTVALLTLYARRTPPLDLSFLPPPLTLQLALPFANAAATAAAYVHVSRFWHGTAKVPAPGLQGYNTAVEATETVVKLLGWLAGLWAVCAVLAAAGQ